VSEFKYLGYLISDQIKDQAIKLQSHDDSFWQTSVTRNTSKNTHHNKRNVEMW